MKYLLKKDLPWIQSGKIFEENNCQPTYSRCEIDNVLLVWPKFANNYPDFFEPIVEKKTYDDLIPWKDRAYYINAFGEVFESAFSWNEKKSTTFLTRQEAEDEHARREWAVRKDRFIPNYSEEYYRYNVNTDGIDRATNYCDPLDVMTINSWLAFRTIEECHDTINNDLIRLFYNIR